MRDNHVKNLQLEKGVRKRVQTWFADLPLTHSIDLSRQGKEDVGSSKARDRTPPCTAGFLYPGYTARWDTEKIIRGCH